MADSDIRRAPDDQTPAKGRRKAKHMIVSLQAVKSRRLVVRHWPLSLPQNA